MTKSAYAVTGLGYGDETKGSITHWLSSVHRAHTVIRVGGPQALHRVVCKNGDAHTFSQFGSGTLRGSATHLSKYMVIDPHAILEEGKVLAYERGIRNIFEMLTIHEDALVITPFQAIACRLRELMRGKNRHGSVGIGVGETVLDSEIPEAITIRAKDLRMSDLRTKLRAVQERKTEEFEKLIRNPDLIPEDVRREVELELAELVDSDTVQWAIERFADLIKCVRIVDTDYVARTILGSDGTVVIENSQGVLLDRWYGFHPYITKVRTTPESALNLLNECGYDGDVQSIGVLRAYHTRHGAGPFVTECPTLTDLLPDTTNQTHPWQGSFRVGQFDMVAARYAVDVCRGSLDGLVISCMDRVPTSDRWEYCGAYRTTETLPERKLSEYFGTTEHGTIEKIRARFGIGAPQSERQSVLGNHLRACTPVLASCGRNSIIPTIERTLGVPVVAVSYGPTECDKKEIKKGSH